MPLVVLVAPPVLCLTSARDTSGRFEIQADGLQSATCPTRPATSRLQVPEIQRGAPLGLTMLLAPSLSGLSRLRQRRRQGPAAGPEERRDFQGLRLNVFEHGRKDSPFLGFLEALIWQSGALERRQPPVLACCPQSQDMYKAPCCRRLPVPKEVSRSVSFMAREGTELGSLVGSFGFNLLQLTFPPLPRQRCWLDRPLLAHE